MEFTGERMIPEYNKEDIIYSEHLLRYSFCKQFVKGKKVLDVACGSGYGTRILADNQAKNVIGVDISGTAVDYANKKYSNLNTEFIVADGTALPFSDGLFDVVVSFETIEHLENHKAFVSQISRVLNETGILVISSPNKDVYPEGNEFHYQELTENEFTALLKKHFIHVEVLKQNNFLISSLYQSESDIVKSKSEILDAFNSQGMYLIAVCSNELLPPILTNNLIASPNEIASQSIVAEREQHIKILDNYIDELKGHIDFFKTHSINIDEYNQIEAKLIELQNDFNVESEKNIYLFNTISRDEKRYDELIILLKEKENLLSDLISAQKQQQALRQELADQMDVLTNEKKELSAFKDNYHTEKEKSEYLFRLKLDNDNQILNYKDEINQFTENQFVLQSTNEKLNRDVETFSVSIENFKNKLSEKLTQIAILEESCKQNDEFKAIIAQHNDTIIDLRNELFDAKSMIIRQNSSIELTSFKTLAFEEKLEHLQFVLKHSNDVLETTEHKLSLTHLELDKKQAIIKEKDGFIHQIATNLETHQILVSKYEEEMYTNLQKTIQLESCIIEKEKHIAELEKELSVKENHILLLDSKIDIYASDISHLKSSISWRLTKPFRLIFNLLLIIFRPLFFLVRDFKYALELLKREGIRSFAYRFFWYLRGKRLIEEIQYLKNKKFFESPQKAVNSTAIICFDQVKNPVVSIVIPVYNQWDYTYNCLNSIYENSKGIDYEVIIADDVSDDETINIKDYIKNIKVVRNKENLRFLLNCNTAAKQAKGDYVLFLNNDTCVHPGWLSYMLDIFDLHDNVGAVGAKLMYEDGRLQEAGGIVWNDASGWNYGRLADPQQPEFNYVKEVDYISGACLMVPNHLWSKLGGFDTHFIPAYYEDTDLCFQIRKEGYKVILQPRATVTHFEGISNGTDLGSGQKKFQVANRQKFYDKWKSDLETYHFNNAENVFLARERSRNKIQVLVIDHYVPHYDKDAGSRSTFSYLKLLVKMGFNVKFIGDNFFKHEPYTTELEQMGVEVLYGNYYFNNVNEWLKENGKYFNYVFAHRMHIAPKYFQVLKKYSKAKIIYIGHDLQFIKSEKQYEITKDEEHLRNQKKFKEIETSIFNSVDIIYPFSTYEESIIKQIVPKKIVRSIPVYFFEDEYMPKNGFDQRKDILFVGGFGHPPNVDAVIWFSKNIFPLILKERPEIIFCVVGSNPPKEIIALASENIVVTGFVSDDELQDYYENCKVSVIPLRVGAGVKGKLLETMYYKLPTVITSVAAEGVPDIEFNCCIADKEQLFAENVLNLYQNPLEWNKYSAKGSSLIKNYYSMNNAEQILRKDIFK